MTKPGAELGRSGLAKVTKPGAELGRSGRARAPKSVRQAGGEVARGRAIRCDLGASARQERPGEGAELGRSDRAAGGGRVGRQQKVGHANKHHGAPHLEAIG